MIKCRDARDAQSETYTRARACSYRYSSRFDLYRSAGGARVYIHMKREIEEMHIHTRCARATLRGGEDISAHVRAAPLVFRALAASCMQVKTFSSASFRRGERSFCERESKRYSKLMGVLPRCLHLRACMGARNRLALYASAMRRRMPLSGRYLGRRFWDFRADFSAGFRCRMDEVDDVMGFRCWQC